MVFFGSIPGPVSLGGKRWPIIVIIIHHHSPLIPVSGLWILLFFSWAFSFANQIRPKVLLNVSCGFCVFLLFAATTRPRSRKRPGLQQRLQQLRRHRLRDRNLLLLDLFGIAESNTCRSFCSLRCTISGLPANTMSSDCCGWPPQRPNSPSNGPPSWN